GHLIFEIAHIPDAGEIEVELANQLLVVALPEHFFRPIGVGTVDDKISRPASKGWYSAFRQPVSNVSAGDRLVERILRRVRRMRYRVGQPKRIVQEKILEVANPVGDRLGETAVEWAQAEAAANP